MAIDNGDDGVVEYTSVKTVTQQEVLICREVQSLDTSKRRNT